MKIKITSVLLLLALISTACKPTQESDEMTTDLSPPDAGTELAAAYILEAGEGEALINDRGHTTYIKVSPETGSTSIAWMATDMRPGSDILVHRHDRAEEVLFLHKGSGTFILGEERIDVHEGATVFVPPGVWHGMENPKEHVHIVFAVSPPGLEHFFREMMWHPGAETKQLTSVEISEIARLHDSVARPPSQ